MPQHGHADHGELQSFRSPHGRDQDRASLGLDTPCRQVGVGLSIPFTLWRLIDGRHQSGDPGASLGGTAVEDLGDMIEIRHIAVTISEAQRSSHHTGIPPDLCQHFGNRVVGQTVGPPFEPSL